MSNYLHSSLRILKNACNEFGYSFSLIDNHSGRLAEISNGKKSFFSSPSRKMGKFPLNSRFSGVVSDKAWTYEILRKKGFDIPLGDYFFLSPKYKQSRNGGKEIGDAFRYAEKLGYPIFVKPNSKEGGKLASKVNSENQFKTHLDKISKLDYIAIVQEFVSGDERKFFVLDDKIKFSSSGMNTFYEHSMEEENLCKSIANLFGLRVCSIDVIKCISKNTKNSVILEVNQNPGLHRLKQRKEIEIWGEILDKYFKE